jgi:hypothetical protein
VLPPRDPISDLIKAPPPLIGVYRESRKHADHERL